MAIDPNDLELLLKIVAASGHARVVYVNGDERLEVDTRQPDVEGHIEGPPPKISFQRPRFNAKPGDR